MARDAKHDSAVVSFDDVRFTYDGVHNALDGVTLDIEEGSFVCILGGNGSGKSTLARHIDALLLPDSGTVRTCGRDTSDPDALFFIRSNAGMVFQNPDDQIVASVIEDDVAFGPENLGLPPAELMRRVTEALAQVGLQGFERRETSALSGGQKQRVAIAGALAMEPRVLVLDEASSMLDPRGRKGLMKACRRLNDAGLTIVMVTHFMDEAVLADRVAVLKGGKVALDGSPEDILERASELQELSLDVPFAVQMSIALQEAGVPVAMQLDLGSLAAEVRSLMEGAHMAGALPRGGEGGFGCSDGDLEHSECDCAQEAMQLQEAPLPDSNAPVLLSFSNVSFTYVPKGDRKRIEKAAKAPGGVRDWGSDPVALWALMDVTFDIHEGEFLGVAGHTGSGKSTLIQLAAGLMPPTSGRIDPKGPDPSRIGIVLQYPENQLFAETVFDDVAFGPRNLGLASGEVENRVRDSLALMRLDVDEIGTKSPFALSGGQQRRVAIAGVLAMEPGTLIFDEPAAGLDPRSHDSLMTLIRRLHDERGKTVVMVSHNMDDIGALCSRMLVLERGRIVADGAPAEVFADAARIKALGLGLPHTLEFANEAGIGFPGSVPTVPQLARAIHRAAEGEKVPGTFSPSGNSAFGGSCLSRGSLEAKAREKSTLANLDEQELVRACDASSEMQEPPESELGGGAR